MTDTERFFILNAMKDGRLIFHPTNGYRTMGITMPVSSEQVSDLIKNGFIKSIRGAGEIYELTDGGTTYMKAFDPLANARVVDFCCQCLGAKPSRYQGMKHGRHWWLCDSCSGGQSK